MALLCIPRPAESCSLWSGGNTKRFQYTHTHGVSMFLSSVTSECRKRTSYRNKLACGSKPCLLHVSGRPQPLSDASRPVPSTPTPESPTNTTSLPCVL